MSLARLTSLSTQTLSLLLERQRLQTLNQSQSRPLSQTPQIVRNLDQLHRGILELEDREGARCAEAAALLRNQHERMRVMLGEEGVERMPPRIVESSFEPESSSTSASTPPPPPKKDPKYVPYTDNDNGIPEPELEPSEMLQHQRHVMQSQDTHLENLSHSLGRQRDISIQINDELEVHTGLLEELDHDLDHTGDRLSGARRRLTKFSRGVKGNFSSYTIAALILVLLILIIIFKT